MGLEKVREIGDISGLIWRKREREGEREKEVLFNFYLIKMLKKNCAWMFCLHVCLCTICIPSAQRGQKRPAGPLELEFQMVVSYCVGLENKVISPGPKDKSFKWPSDLNKCNQKQRGQLETLR